MLSQRNCLSSRTFAIFGLVMVGLIGIAQPAYCVTVSVSASLTADGLDLVATVTAGGSCGTINLYAAVDAPVDTNGFFHQCPGACTVQYGQGMSCTALGQHTINVMARGYDTDANGCNVPTQATSSTTFTVTRSGSLSVVPHWQGVNVFADYIATLFACSGQDSVDFFKMGTDKNGPGLITYDVKTNGVHWTNTIFQGDLGSTDAVHAHLYGCGELQDSTTFLCKDNECDSCPDPSGQADPIKITNGNMRETDGEPLPAGPFTMRRTYDSSRSTEARFFGKGWSSPLDAYMVSETDAKGVVWVAVATPDGNRRVFAGSNAGFVQKAPLGQNPATFTYDSSTSLYAPVPATGESRRCAHSPLDGR